MLAIADVDGIAVAALVAPNEYPVGVTTRTFTFSDASGNSSTCSFTITVVDNQFPTVVSCPGNITVPADAGACGANVSYALPTFNDNCLFRVDLTEGLASGAFFPVGTTQVKYLATDSSNHSVNCVFNVIVQDLQNPVIAGCPSNINAQAPLAGTGATATWAPPTATDNCGVASITQTAGQAPGSFFSIGAHTITYTATGPNGGTSTCTFTVTVISNGAPTITCPANQTRYSTQSNCAQVFNYATPPVSDDLPLPGGQPVQIDGTGYTSGSAFPQGTTVQTWRVTDSNANSTTCTFNVQVIDTIRPSLQTCPTNITLNADAGACGAIYTYTPPTAMDNCDGPLTVVRVLGPPSGSLFPIGTTIVLHRATDLSGRFRNCEFTVTVVDNIFPALANCPADMDVDAEANACGAHVTFTTPAASDNCTAALTQTLGPVSGSLFPIGDTPVEFTATDPAGQAVTCGFNVHVDDTTPPTFTYCPDTISVTSTVSLCGAAVTYAAPVAADNCSSLMTLPAGQLSGDFFPVGYISVSYTATDGTNAPAVCTFVVEGDR
ncbi:MAG: HYR domain-containing protein [Flavobacteriales bacterium]|nr:HYR domain-containing protein [Flavobacteriales bacterium]